MGAGFLKGSSPFHTATELMGKSHTQEQAPQPIQGGEPEPPSQPCVLQDEDRTEPPPGPSGEAPASSAYCGGPSPEKKPKGSCGDRSVAKAWASKKQQLLATAAHKDSQNFTHFFCQRAGNPLVLSAAPRAEGASRSWEGVQGPLMAPEKNTEKEDGAQGRITALHTEKLSGEQPR